MLFFQLGDTSRPQRKRGGCEPASNYQTLGETSFLNQKQTQTLIGFTFAGFLCTKFLVYSLDGKKHIIVIINQLEQ